MKRNLLFIAVSLLTSSLLAAPKDEVQSAAKKLSDAGNYSWKTSVDNPGGRGGGGGGGRRGGRGGFFGGGGPSEGKVSKDGYVVITRTFGDNSFQTIVKGEKVVMQNQDGEWQTPAEMFAAFGGGGGGQGRGGRGGGLMARMYQTPAGAVEDLLGKVKEVKHGDNAFTADLTEDGAKSFLTFGGGRGGGDGPEISGAKGSVKIWVKDGMLSKYELKVQGTVSFNGNDREINRTTTVEIKDVGTTKVEVPEAAKKKLS